MTNPGKLIIVSGPSGSGKSTVVQRLLGESVLPLVLSISATTRPPRAGEENGREYIFLSDEEFQSQTPQPACDAAWDRVRAER